MEKEISSGAMLGIVLIALAAVIGLGFGVFAIAKGTANEGITGVQDSLGAVSESGFDDYNQKTVTGSSVKSAITNYKGKPYAILVNTIAMNNGQVTQSAHKSAVAFVGQDTVAKCFVNFNALLSTDGSALLGKAVATGAAMQASAGQDIGGGALGSNAVGADKMYLRSGTYVTAAAFQMVDGNIQYDDETASINTTGDCLNIPDNTKFKANLIKDASGTIKGIVFEQQKK